MNAFDDDRLLWIEQRLEQLEQPISRPRLILPEASEGAAANILFYTLTQNMSVNGAAAIVGTVAGTGSAGTVIDAVGTAAHQIAGETGLCHGPFGGADRYRIIEPSCDFDSFGGGGGGGGSGGGPSISANPLSFSGVS